MEVVVEELHDLIREEQQHQYGNVCFDQFGNVMRDGFGNVMYESSSSFPFGNDIKRFRNDNMNFQDQNSNFNITKQSPAIQRLTEADILGVQTTGISPNLSTDNFEDRRNQFPFLQTNERNLNDLRYNNDYLRDFSSYNNNMSEQPIVDDHRIFNESSVFVENKRSSRLNEFEKQNINLTNPFQQKLNQFKNISQTRPNTINITDHRMTNNNSKFDARLPQPIREKLEIARKRNQTLIDIETNKNLSVNERAEMILKNGFGNSIRSNTLGANFGVNNSYLNSNNNTLRESIERPVFSDSTSNFDKDINLEAYLENEKKITNAMKQQVRENSIMMENNNSLRSNLKSNNIFVNRARTMREDERMPFGNRIKPIQPVGRGGDLFNAETGQT